ncbi:phosphoribosylamine--glycine ligase [Jeotgalibacillus sp. S-D1]|uniref:phosphoribosylamine--glycine ligase n=1 Tax=Jeotgalibacillus sp. S-D1 TaxID=2552189 RepID=UPI001059EEAD|nr:phosphoribosylamine--glycine ligase [Jeotgalibacillus sp. S-D1]TDL30619.1 phosphoribosylamine--glycine ligase [Jeotgalibacillus sp. S-D1]
MNVLVIGRGGREHAICWTLSQAKSVSRVFCAPGNAGIANTATRVDIDESSQELLVQFARENDIALTIVGPEQPLAEGIVDRFLSEGLTIFGPSKEAAIIEGSKSYAKDLMKKYNVPTAAYETFTDAESAKEYILKHGAPIVIKADGLAAGKGVVVAMSQKEAMDAIEDMLIHQQFGSSSSQIVIEEFLEGEEFSLMALVHQDKIIPLEIAQDHKRAYDGDKGPNTGGMGAYSPVAHLPENLTKHAMKEILQPVVDAMITEGRPFTGVLYAGLILTSEGPKVIEFNARFGDPETQVVLPRMNSDLAQLILKLLQGETEEVDWDPRPIAGVVLAAEGYPGNYQKGIKLHEFTQDHEFIFHAGTELEEGQLVSTGGRVLLAARMGKTIGQAQKNVYAYLKEKKADGLYYRKDIAHRAISSL